MGGEGTDGDLLGAAGARDPRRLVADVDRQGVPVDIRQVDVAHDSPRVQGRAAPGGRPARSTRRRALRGARRRIRDPLVTFRTNRTYSGKSPVVLPRAVGD